jgi:hypothetical protein
VGLEGRVLVAVASAQGEMFTQRRDTLNRLLRSLGLSAVYATAVAREMVAEGGELEVCRPVRPGEEGLPNSYFANALNQLQLLMRAWRDGYSHVLVLEDDVTLAPAFADVAYARSVLREVAAEVCVHACVCGFVCVRGVWSVCVHTQHTHTHTHTLTHTHALSHTHTHTGAAGV